MYRKCDTQVCGEAYVLEGPVVLEIKDYKVEYIIDISLEKCMVIQSRYNN